ncbi:MAG: tetratricopeptide repeat protein [Candidatus Dormibacteria bacterium]
MPPARSLPSGRLTFVFTDIEGSTRLFRQVGDEFSTLLATHFEVLRASFQGHGGIEVRTIGDALFAVFTDAADALWACVEAQSALAAEPSLRAGKLRVRMGVHGGDAEPRGDDYVSLAVHQAARVVAAAHGGQVLASAESVAQAEATGGPPAMVALGDFWLKDFDQPVGLFQVDALGTAPELRAPRAPSATASNLPRPRTSFVGRREVLGRLAGLVSGSRLVTIVGPGGVGKTRVAVELAGNLAARFHQGVWFADLSGVTDAQALVVSVATQLGAIKPGSPALDGIAELVSGDALLVVDNCEHLVDSAARLVDQLLSACPGLHILATSRELLRVEDEQGFQLDPLPLPGPQATPEELEGVDSWQLFYRRALRVKDDLLLDADAAALVGSICRRLDGIPLALELAAARLSVVTLEQLHAAVERRFEALTDGLRTAPARQRTLHGMIEWSWSLLSPAEQRLAARSSIFRGGFTSDAAAAVTADPGELAETLDALCARSLLSLEEGPHPRYRMLETIREFCELRLRDSGEFPLALSSMLDWSMDFAGRAHRGTLGPGWLRAIEDLDDEIANLRHAMALGLEAGDRRAAILGYTITNYWGPRAAVTEGIDWCVRLEPLLKDDEMATARIRSRQGALLLDRGDVAAAIPLIEGAAPLLLQSDRHGDPSDVRAYLGTVRLRQGRMQEAIAIADELIASIDEDELPTHASQGYLQRGLARFHLGELEGAADSMEHALDIARRHQLTRVTTVTVNNLGIVYTGLGRHREAAELLDESVAVRRLSNDMRGLAAVLVNLGNLKGLLGDLPGAAAAYLEAFEWAVHADVPIAAVAVQGLAETAVSVDRPSDAALLYGAVERLLGGSERAFDPGRQEELEALKMSIEAHLDAGEFAHQREAGAQMDDDRVVVAAREIARAAGAETLPPTDPAYR